MKRWLYLVFSLLLYVTSASAQTAVVKHNVNVRPDASTTHPPVAHLTVGDTVDLIDSSATNGFLHIKMKDGTDGWAWSRNLTVSAAPTAATGQPAGPPANQPTGQRVGPASLYPNPSLTSGKADTLVVADLTKRYTQNCPSGKASCTYSESHRNVPSSVHTHVYDEYNVPQSKRNKIDGEVDHLYPLCAGGSNDISNLWYQPAVNLWNGKNFGFHTKDILEVHVCELIKNHNLDPQEAFDRLTKDWVRYYMDLGLEDPQ
jgi:uncharacterized protein YgiM (DUF1202 family)